MLQTLKKPSWDNAVPESKRKAGAKPGCAGCGGTAWVQGTDSGMGGQARVGHGDKAELRSCEAGPGWLRSRFPVLLLTQLNGSTESFQVPRCASRSGSFRSCTRETLEERRDVSGLCSELAVSLQDISSGLVQTLVDQGQLDWSRGGSQAKHEQVPNLLREPRGGQQLILGGS
ncbi:hypothetical protein GRJ2_002530600 [Grus japonensis]|uniref:Uncharacterized protein n=1 Tax=Grus japonensis TaxID=30415 RepID=A0ABC9XSM2_GRUJA